MEDKELLKKGTESSAYTIGFKVISQLFLLLSTIVLVRILSKHDYGVYNLFYSVIGLIGIVASFGIVNVLNRYLPEYFRKKEFILAGRLIRNAAALRLAGSTVILFLFVWQWDSLAPYFKIHEYRSYFVLFVFVILLYQQWILFKIVLEAHFLHKYSLGLYAIFLCIRFLGYAVVLSLRQGLLWIFIIDLLIYALLCAFYIIIYIRKIPGNTGTNARFGREDRGRIIRYSLYYNFNDMGSSFLGTGVDNLIIAYFLDPVLVGIYAFCDRIAKMIGQFSPVNYLSEVIRPLFVSIGITSDRQQVNAMYQFLIKYTYLFYVPAFFFVALYGRELIDLIFGKYSEHHHILTGVFGFAALSAFALPVGLVAQLKERADVVLMSKIFGLYNLIADIVFIQFWGIWGIVVATGTAVLFKNLFILWFIGDYLSLREIRGFLITLVVYWSVCSFVVTYGIHAAEPSGGVVISILLFISLFLAYLKLVFRIDERERRLFITLTEDYTKLSFLRRYLAKDCLR